MSRLSMVTRHIETVAAFGVADARREKTGTSKSEL